MKRAALALLLLACGYRSTAPGGEREHVSVVLVSSNVPSVTASDEVVAGLRDELARAGALEAGSGYPRCEVEVLRADEASEGIAAVKNGDGELVPTSRATRVGIVARAWVVRSKDGPRERDTGDVRALETIAVAANARAATFEQEDGLRAAARRAGKRLGIRILGLPSPSED
jgi:hypothetical protein